jgi:hypothetical protein
LYELAGDWGLEPNRLLSFTIREVYQFAKGVKKRRALEENNIRRFAYLFAQANKDPKRSFPKIQDFWPIPYLDEAFSATFDNPEKNNEIKAKLMQAWQLSQN